MPKVTMGNSLLIHDDDARKGEASSLYTRRG